MKKKLPKGRDETECPAKAGREPNRKMASPAYLVSTSQSEWRPMRRGAHRAAALALPRVQL